MTRRIKARAAKFAVAILATAVAVAIAAVASTAMMNTPTYKNIASPLPGNVPSLGFEATSTSEFGGQVGFVGKNGDSTKVAVAMSSWACQQGTWNEGTCETAPGAKFSWPVTLRIYVPEPDGSVGPQIAQLTQTFKMPYRPSASPKCTGGRWYRYGQCFNGKLFKITFPLKGVYLSEKAIISVAYNTSHYGAEPQAPQACNSESQGCPYDSLNVGLTGTPSPGSFPQPNDAYLDSTWAGAYCDSGAEGTGTFRLDAGCWEGYQPEFEVTTG